MHRVVITGIGAVSPLGLTFRDSWAQLKMGVSGISTLSRFDSSGLKWKLAGELKGFEPGAYLPSREARILDPFVSFAAAAASMAAEDAGLTTLKHAPLFRDASVIVGSSRAGITTLEAAALTVATGKKRLSPFVMPVSTLYLAPSTVAGMLGIQGECLGVSTACASGLHALGEAFRQIRAGITTLALAGGTEAPLCRTCFKGYGAAGALSSGTSADASRPFAMKRDGFILSEGACMLVLENYAGALKRNANIYAEIVGYANVADAYHMTRPRLSSQIHALQKALRDAHLHPDDIDFVNAHGTSTPIGDAVESAAIRSVFGSRSLPVTAAKSMTGHMLAASAAFESACAAMTLADGYIPPTINLSDPDPQCDLSFVTRLEKTDATYALTSSFGFGGANAVLILNKCR
ncbi:MAG: 3-oxoacyl-acyl-carrier-protein synthase II [Nitrospirae bacterium]|nr:MAG: 3-oxoacyl-acyl-carrier-protein synthase II [Nitrospirota bacterium]